MMRVLGGERFIYVLRHTRLNARTAIDRPVNHSHPYVFITACIRTYGAAAGVCSSSLYSFFAFFTVERVRLVVFGYHAYARWHRRFCAASISASKINDLYVNFRFCFRFSFADRLLAFRPSFHTTHSDRCAPVSNKYEYSSSRSIQTIRPTYSAHPIGPMACSRRAKNAAFNFTELLIDFLQQNSRDRNAFFERNEEINQFVIAYLAKTMDTNEKKPAIKTHLRI